jgi:hypothetical protein
MVTFIERNICLLGIVSFYSYTLYKFIKTKVSFNKKFHESAIIQAEKFTKDMNNPNLKYLATENEKLLFLLGVENNYNALKKENLIIVDRIIEEFTPTCFIYEKELSQ